MAEAGAVGDVTVSSWARIRALFAEAMERPASDRAAFLASLPESDAPLRDELASLLDAADGTDSFPAARAGIARAAGMAGGVAFQSLLTAALGQQYEIVRSLGQGGMGAVYLARERSLERFVAVKVLRPDLADAEESRERFRREARVVAQLSHPSILPLHTFGEVGGTWYFVMGYVRGTSLAERLHVEGRLPADEALRFFSELADALECAHRSGIVHRDIKPSNILLDSDSGRAVLADFGISKVQGAVDSLTATGLVMGTPHFMSPEQALGAEVDERSDIYSLGAVAYTMLAGREPYGELPTERLMLHRQSYDPPSLESIVPSVPRELAAIVMRCLSRDPALRWPSAHELREALARASDERHALPEAMRELPMFGPYALIWMALWTGLAARPFHSITERMLLVLIALIVPVGLLMQLWTVAPGGMSRRELARVAFWPPEWWGMWWPRALRRPSDLWKRLPWPARAVRVLLSAFIVALPTMILAREWVEVTSGASPAAVRDAFARVEWTLVLITGAGVLASLVWAMSRRLPVADTVRVLVGATLPGHGWDDPRVARLLAPRAGARQPAADSPADHLRAIADVARQLPDIATADLRAALTTAARALFDTIERCDSEIAQLSCDADAGEMDRLATQIASIDSGTAIDERKELAELLRRELDLLRRMRVRCELVSQRRARSFSQLRGLYQRACAARDERTAEAMERLKDVLESDRTAR